MTDEEYLKFANHDPETYALALHALAARDLGKAALSAAKDLRCLRVLLEKQVEADNKGR